MVCTNFVLCMNETRATLIKVTHIHMEIISISTILLKSCSTISYLLNRSINNQKNCLLEVRATVNEKSNQFRIHAVEDVDPLFYCANHSFGKDHEDEKIRTTSIQFVHNLTRSFFRRYFTGYRWKLCGYQHG